MTSLCIQPLKTNLAFYRQTLPSALLFFFENPFDRKFLTCRRLAATLPLLVFFLRENTRWNHFNPFLLSAAPENHASSPPIEFRIPWDYSPDSSGDSESEYVSMSERTESYSLESFFSSSSFLASSFAFNRRDLLSTGCTCFAILNAGFSLAGSLTSSIGACASFALHHHHHNRCIMVRPCS